MTPETKLRLLHNTEKNITSTTEAVDSTRNLIKQTIEIDSILNENGHESGFEKIISLLEFRLLVGILFLDLTTAVRIYLLN